MNEPITFSFSPTRSDYYQTLRAFSFRQRSIKMTLIAPCLLLLALAYTSIASRSFSIYTGVVLLFVFLVFLSLFFLSPASVADKVSKDERLSCETTWAVDEDKIAINNKFSEVSFDWGTLGQAYETKEHYMVSYSSNKVMFQILPKRAFISEAQQAEFRKLLEAKTKPVKRISAVSLPELSRKTSLLILYGIVALLIIILVMTSFIRASSGLIK